MADSVHRSCGRVKNYRLLFVRLALAFWHCNSTANEPPWKFEDYDCEGPGYAYPWSEFLESIPIKSKMPIAESNDIFGLVTNHHLDELMARMNLLRECPFGELTFFSLLLLGCAVEARPPTENASMDSCLETFGRTGALNILIRYPLRISSASRWPFLHILISPLIHGKLTRSNGELDCLNIQDPIVDWEELSYLSQAATDQFESPGDTDFLFQTVAAAFRLGSKGSASVTKALHQCPMGYVTSFLSHSLSMLTTETVYFAAGEESLRNVLGNIVSTISTKQLFSCRWPILPMIWLFQKGKRHNFKLDYNRKELQFLRRVKDEAVTFTKHLAVMAQGSSTLHLDVVSQLMNSRDVFLLPTSEQKRAYKERFLGRHVDVGEHIQVVSQSDEAYDDFSLPSTGFVYVTMIFGEMFSQLLGSFVRRFTHVTQGRRNLIIFALDEVANRECEQVWPGGCVASGHPSIMHKFLIPWIYNIYDIDVVWVDFDVYFWQDPTLDILEHQKRGGFELLISGSFATDCICNGIVYFRATETMRIWLLDVIHWMYDHPYEHDQKCFAAWLNHTERVSYEPLPRTGPLPKWDTLESTQKFVTAAVVEGNGWMADSWRSVVLFHFLHGESDMSGFAFSGKWVQNSVYFKAVAGSFGNQRERSQSANSRPMNLMFKYFGNDSTLEGRIWALEQSRQRSKPTFLKGRLCGFTGESEEESIKPLNFEMLHFTM